MGDGDGEELEPVASIRLLTGAAAGRKMRLIEDRPLRIDMRAKGASLGNLVFRRESGAWVFINESTVPSAVNRSALRRAVLADQDLIEVGSMRFRVDIPVVGVGRTGTTSIGEVDPLVDDATESYSDEQIAEMSRRDPPPEPMGRETGISGRTSRRISASHEAIVDERPSSSTGRLLKTMGRAFRRRGGQRELLTTLETQRAALLAEAGRRALEGLGGFGLDPAFLQRLCNGVRLELTSNDLDPGQLRRFREDNQRLTALDVEINALRRELGLPSEPRRLAARAPLPTEQQAQRERAFAASDAMATEDLEAVQVDEAGAEVHHDPSPSESRRRRLRRRH